LYIDVISYAGELENGGLPAHGWFDFRFTMYDGPGPGPAEQIGDVVELNNIEVIQGRFSVDLDFGPELENQSSRWIDIQVARSDRLGGFSQLEPRQPASATAPAKLAATIPSGAVVFFNLGACPNGWTEHTNARGRAVVGLPTGGTLGGTVGTPFGNLEEGKHNHTLSATVSTNLAGRHNHIWSSVQSVGGDVQWQTYDASGVLQLAYFWQNGIGSEGSGIYPLAAQPSQTLYTNEFGGHAHDLTIGPVATTNNGSGLPYVQLLACRKD